MFWHIGRTSYYIHKKKGLRRKMKETKSKKQIKILNYVIIGAIFGIMLWFVVEEYKDIQFKKQEIARKSSYETQNISIANENTNEKKENETNREVLTGIAKEYPKEEIIERYKGYDVAAKLEIPEIALNTYILKQYSKNALNVSVTKFWGADPNQIGNFCVAGHNFQNKNMFHNLRSLEVGNRLVISEPSIGRVEYEVYDIYLVEPEDVRCLSQETNGKREVTLITCTTDSKKRIIVKAREVES